MPGRRQHRGLVLVPASVAGVGVTPGQGLDVLREFGEVHFDRVRVSADALLCIGSGSARLAEEARRLATCLQLAESVGAVDRLSTLLIEYARHRHAFGRPIGGFQALKHRIADITLLVESCKGAADAAVDAVSNDSEDADLLISVAKSYIGDRSIRIAQECTQMFGGIGLTWEHDAHLYLRRVTSNLQYCRYARAASSTRHRNLARSRRSRRKGCPLRWISRGSVAKPALGCATTWSSRRDCPPRVTRKTGNCRPRSPTQATQDCPTRLNTAVGA